MMTNKILQPGFIGLGLMGQPMSQRLLQAGFPLTVWNRSPDKADALITAGASLADTPGELVKAVDVVMLCLTDSNAVDAIVCGSIGFLEQLKPGQIVVDFSSISPDTTRELAASVEAKGASWLDCPISGGVAGAESGALSVMVGGDPTVLDEVRPLLQPLSQNITHVGACGSGQTVKIINQMIVSCNVLVIAEALAMAEKANVNTAQIPAALAGGFADSKPLQITGQRMAEGDFGPLKWHVRTLLKDLDMAKALAQSLGSAIPMSGQGAELMRLHGSQGFLDKDPATLIQMYQEKDDETGR